MDKGLTVPKWVLIVLLKIPPNALEFVCSSLKVLDFNEKRLHWASVVRVQMHPGQALKKLFLFSPSKIELSGEFFAHVTSLKNTAKQVATKSLQTFGCILHAYLIRCPKCGPWYLISRKNYAGFLGNGELLNHFLTFPACF